MSRSPRAAAAAHLMLPCIKCLAQTKVKFWQKLHKPHAEALQPALRHCTLLAAYCLLAPQVEVSLEEPPAALHGPQQQQSPQSAPLQSHTVIWNSISHSRPHRECTRMSPSCPLDAPPAAAAHTPNAGGRIRSGRSVSTPRREKAQ